MDPSSSFSARRSAIIVSIVSKKTWLSESGRERHLSKATITSGEKMKHQILLVDDDHDIVRGTILRLQASGYDVIQAHDGRRGLEMAVREQPDAILLDVRMPKMNGLDTLDELRLCETTKDIPIVMLSASIVDQQRALDAGARFFVRKPYQGKSLVAALQSAMADTSPQSKDLH